MAVIALKHWAHAARPRKVSSDVTSSKAKMVG